MICDGVDCYVFVCLWFFKMMFVFFKVSIMVGVLVLFDVIFGKVEVFMIFNWLILWIFSWLLIIEWVGLCFIL